MTPEPLLLVYDIAGWAFHNTAAEIKAAASPEFAVTLMSEAEFADASDAVLDGFPAALFFSWYAEADRFPHRKVCLLANHGCQYDPWECRLSGANCDHTDHDWRAVAATRSRNRRNFLARVPDYDAVLAVNRELAAWASRFHPQVAFTPIGVDASRYAGTDANVTSNGRLRVGWCGQVDPPPLLNQKGYGWIFEPVREQATSFCEFHINSRPPHQALSRDEMATWYQNLDVFLCTSISEGSPNTAMEALTAGVPVVATSVGDLPEVVTNGSNGYLVGGYQDQAGARRVIEDCVACLRELYQNRELLRHQKRQARHTMLSRRSWRTLASQWLHLIAGGAR